MDLMNQGHLESQEELRRYKELASHLIDARERMNIFQKSLEALGLCKSVKGVMTVIIDILQGVLPIENYHIYQRCQGKWSLVSYAKKDSVPPDESDLDWTLSHEEPAILPVNDPVVLERGVRSHLLFPLRTPKSVVGCVVGWMKKEAGDFPQDVLHRVSALNAETAIVFGNIQTNEQLLLRNLYLQDVFESLPHAVLTINGDGKIDLFNQNAETLFGTPALLVMDEPYKKVLPQGFSEQVMEAISYIFKGQRFGVLPLENNFAKNSGKLHFSVHLSPILDGHRGVVGVSLMVF